MQRHPPPAVTVEGALLGATLLVAFLLRFTGLDGDTLSPSESSRAYAAWQLASGQFPQWWDAPAFVLMTALGLTLFGASDASARLASAVAGTGLVAALWLYRDWLGRWVVLIGTGLLALSPTAIAVARTSSEASLAALLTLLVGWVLLRFWEEDNRPYVGLGAGGVAALLNLGYAGVTGLMALVLFGVAYYAVRPQGLATTAPVWLKQWPRLALPFLGTFLLVATGLFLFPRGFGLPSLQAWVQQVDPTPTGLPWYQPWLLLSGYELLAVALGLPASILSLRRWVAAPLDPSRRATALLSLWALLGLLFFLLAGEPAAPGMFMAVLPLTLVAGYYLAHGLAELDLGTWRRMAPLALYIGVLLGFAGITLLETAQGRGAYGGVGVVLTAAALLLASFILFSAALAAPKPWAVLSLAASSLGLLITVHSASKQPFGAPWPGTPKLQSYGVTAVTELLRLTPYTAQGQRQQVSVEADLRDSLAWYLRDYPGVAYVTRLQPGPAVLVAKEDANVANLSGYQRLSLPLAETWVPKSWTWSAVWRWLLLGETRLEDRAAERIALLVRS